MIFQGGRQTRECAFTKLIGVEHDDGGGSTTFSVSNRQKPTTIHYGSGLSGPIHFRLDLAIAHFKGTVDDLIRQLQGDLAQIDARRPVEVGAPSARVLESTARSMAAWTDGPGGHAFNAICDAMHELDAAGNADWHDRQFAACLRIAEAVKAGRSASPIPDREAQSLWAQALHELTDCIAYTSDGLERSDHDLIGRANESLRAAQAHLVEIGRRFGAVSAGAFGSD